MSAQLGSFVTHNSLLAVIWLVIQGYPLAKQLINYSINVILYIYIVELLRQRGQECQ